MTKIIFKGMASNIAGDRIYKGAILLTEGIYTDMYSQKTIYYDGRVIRKNAKNWKDNYVTIDHSTSVLDRIGYVENPRWEDDALKGDIRILPITTRAKDVINLIDNDLTRGLSIEAETQDQYDGELKCLRLIDITFLGVSIVTDPACEMARIL